MKAAKQTTGRLKTSKDRIMTQWVVHSGNKVHVYALTAADKIEIIRAGVTKKQLTEIKEEMDLDYDQLSQVLSTSRATLINKKRSEKFDAQISERLVMLNEVLGYGREVFGDKDNFNEWLRTPSEALGNATPLSLMDTLYGIDEVKKEIGRIAYGVY